MRKPIEQNVEQEALALAKRFEAVENRARFARDHQIPGKGAMIYQHITGRKPISLESAMAYMRGFNCGLADISPYWAQVVQSIPISANEPPAAYRANIEPLSARRPALSALQAQLIDITSTMNDIGLAILIGRAQELAMQHPAQAVKNRQN